MLKYLRMGSKRTKAIWWALIVLTVGTFIGGFIFLFGAGIGSHGGAANPGAVAMVDGQPITRAEYMNAVEEQRRAYQNQYKTAPVDQDARMIEAQAWRNLVMQRVITEEAQRLGLKATDQEVVLAMQTSPPQALASVPDFQTDGKFDPDKYRAALQNPNNNWAPFEDLVRSQLPLRKLQERLASSVKLSQPELNDAMRNRFERMAATAIHVMPAMDGPAPPVSEADLDRVYQKYRGRFASGPTTEAEVLSVPRTYTDEEKRIAREAAEALVTRARAGEDFALLARDHSEGPGADRGGEIDRMFQPSEFGPELAPRIAAMQKGDVSDPLPEAGRYIVIKVIDRTEQPGGAPGLRLAQIVVKMRGSDEEFSRQYQAARKIRDRATRVGLSKAATEAGLATTRTGPFDYARPPAQLYTVPEAMDWAVGAKPKAVSPTFRGLEEFVIAQIVSQRPAGTAAKSEVLEQVRQVAELEARTAKAKSKADEIAKLLAEGRTLEQAGEAAGVAAFQVAAMSRTQPDPRLGGSPEVVGALFASPAGKVVGPIQAPMGWYFGRVDSRAPLDSMLFQNTQIKGQITTDILQRKQNEFFSSWVAEQRLKAKVKDLRE